MRAGGVVGPQAPQKAPPGGETPEYIRRGGGGGGDGGAEAVRGPLRGSTRGVPARSVVAAARAATHPHWCARYTCVRVCD